MNNWTQGYVSDISYTHGYYSELNPLRVDLAMLNAGFISPQIEYACELGFGQGLSTNLHVSASLTKWYGTDFNPCQVSFAKELAKQTKTDEQLYDESFSEFSKRELPEFDYIGVHGIWSWISDDNRKVIVDFVRRKLKVGGVLYISYNTLPGWCSFAPMRHLLTQHAKIEGSYGAGIVSRINDAIEFSEKLLAVNPAFARANPQIAERFEILKGHNRQYLAHEYFNADWEPMYFSDINEWLTSAKLSFACSANLLDSVQILNLTNEQSDFLNGISDTIFRETTRDFILNQQFRKDYWVKGPRKIDPIRQVDGLRGIRLLLTTQADLIPLKVSTLAGVASLSEAVYKPLINLLSDHKVRSVAQLEEHLVKQGLTWPQIIQAVVVMVSLGHLAIAQDEGIANKRLKSTQALNTHLMELARSSGDIAFLASPVTGGGHSVPRFQQIFLLARQQGHKTPAQWAEFAWMLLKTQGQSLLKDGQVLMTEEENLAELKAQAADFEAKHLPILKALQIA